jgi:hypothetical protein
LIHDWKRHNGVQLGLVESDLNERAKLVSRPNMLEELEHASCALLMTQVSIADAKALSRTKDHGSRRFGAMPALRQTGVNHLFLDVVQLLFRHVTARKTMRHAG